MKISMVMTLIGKDRPGLVESLSRTVEEHGGNWEESRMAHLAGQFAGKSLDQLDLDDLLKLLRECRDDDESVAMLQAYLDREHTDWQQHAGAEGQQQSTAVPGEMSRDEAWQVLGLPADAGEADIIEAHRRLMQKLHPDRGGSAYLAATINLAKQTLLGR